MQKLEGKIALVTGGGRGIGRAVAELFAREGATVVVVARTQSELLQVAEGIEETGGQAVPLVGDITSATFVRRVFRTVEKRFGRLDILVNSAGAAPFGPVEELEPKQLRDVLELNITAVFAYMQQAIRIMNANGGVGKIINIGSVRSHWTEAGDAGAYNASKYGLRGMTESVARQLHGTGSNIAVGLVCPGVVDTPLTNPDGEPRPDWMRPETVAEAVLYTATAPANVNVFDLTLFSTHQQPW